MRHRPFGTTMGEMNPVRACTQLRPAQCGDRKG